MGCSILVRGMEVPVKYGCTAERGPSLEELQKPYNFVLSTQSFCVLRWNQKVVTEALKVRDTFCTD